MRSRYVPDSGLGVRMLVTMFLLGLLYVVLMVVLIYAFELHWTVVLLLAGAGLFVQYWFSDRLALTAMRGRVVSPQEAPELHGIVDRLCALADMPKPQVAIAHTDLPNAFATGRSPDRAVVCATTGLLRRLDAREIEAVLSHELAHVAHRDVAVMTIASFVSILAGLLLRSMAWGGYGGRRRQEGNAAAAVLLVVLVSVVVYALSFLLIRVLSRYRELSADRAGALLTGQPSALASALVKLHGEMGRIPTKDLRTAEAYNAFFFVPAFAKGFSLSTLFSTHPSLEARLAQLSGISGQLGQAG
jgi:heat shock protein HtpX